MNYADFDKIGVYEIACGDVDAVPPGLQGSFYVFNMQGGDVKDRAFVGACAEKDRMYTGRFVDGFWKGWQAVGIAGEDVSTKKIEVKQESGTNAWSIVASDGELRFMCKSDDADAEKVALTVKTDGVVTKKLSSAIVLSSKDDGISNIWIS